MFKTFHGEIHRRGPGQTVEFESRVRIRTEMTDVGQGRHYLFTPEMTALRPQVGRSRGFVELPKADAHTAHVAAGGIDRTAVPALAPNKAPLPLDADCA